MPVLVDREEHRCERLDGHKQIVDDKHEPTAVTLREIVDQSHSVEAAERMIARDDHPPLLFRRQTVGVDSFDSDVEIVKHSAAEFSPFFREIVLKQCVEPVLADKFLKFFQQK